MKAIVRVKNVITSSIDIAYGKERIDEMVKTEKNKYVYESPMKKKIHCQLPRASDCAYASTTSTTSTTKNEINFFLWKKKKHCQLLGSGEAAPSSKKIECTN